MYLKTRPNKGARVLDGLDCLIWQHTLDIEGVLDIIYRSFCRVCVCVSVL